MLRRPRRNHLARGCIVAKSAPRNCTQRTDGVCAGAFLEQVIKGPSIKYAFCNDKWLVLLSSGEGGVFEPHLNNVPSPPLGVSGGVTYCTGDPTRTVDRYYSLQYPLDVVDLPEGSWTNNVDLFDGTAGNEGIPYLYDDGLGIGTYGLPDGAGVGITVNGLVYQRPDLICLYAYMLSLIHISEPTRPY